MNELVPKKVKIHRSEPGTSIPLNASQQHIHLCWDAKVDFFFFFSFKCYIEPILLKTKFSLFFSS